MKIYSQCKCIDFRQYLAANLQCYSTSCNSCLLRAMLISISVILRIFDRDGPLFVLRRMGGGGEVRPLSEIPKKIMFTELKLSNKIVCTPAKEKNQLFTSKNFHKF